MRNPFCSCLQKINLFQFIIINVVASAILKHINKKIRSNISCYHFQEYSWTDKSPYLLRDWLDVKVLIDSFGNLTVDTSEYTVTRSSINNSFITMKEKFMYLKSYHASNRSIQCTALFSNVATPSTWTAIGCNDIFEHNYFLCERHVPEKNFPENRSLIQQETPMYLCPRRMILLTEYCWYIKLAIHGLAEYSANVYEQPNIDSFLTSLFLGMQIPIYIGLQLSSKEIQICLTAVSKYHQKYRGWKLISCTKENITHRLLRYQAIVSLNPCDNDRYFTCEEGSCILNTGRCDGRQDCKSHTDEMMCDTLCKTQDIQNIECYSSYTCGTGQSIPRWHRCDGVAHCTDSTDEVQCFFIVYPRNGVDAYIREHLQRKSNGTCGRNMLMCDLDDDGFCYHQHGWCVYEVVHGSVLHCPGLQHLHFCEHYECPGMFQCSMSYCIPIYMTCNGIADCPKGELCVTVN